MKEETFGRLMSFPTTMCAKSVWITAASCGDISCRLSRNFDQVRNDARELWPSSADPQYGTEPFSGQKNWALIMAGFSFEVHSRLTMACTLPMWGALPMKWPTTYDAYKSFESTVTSSGRSTTATPTFISTSAGDQGRSGPPGASGTTKLPVTESCGAREQSDR
ncbi:hypothetical protein Bca101_081548 [Brassica carinata]